MFLEFVTAVTYRHPAIPGCAINPGWEDGRATAPLASKHIACVRTARFRGPPEPAGLLVRLRSHLITGDPCRSTQHCPLDKHASAPYYTHTHTHAQRSPTVHFNANKGSPLFWAESLPHGILSCYRMGI